MGQIEWDRYHKLQVAADFIWSEDGDTDGWEEAQAEADRAYEEYEVAAGLRSLEDY